MKPPVELKFFAHDESYTHEPIESFRLQVENGGTAPVAPEFGIRWPAAVRETQDFKEQTFAVLHQGDVERQLRSAPPKNRPVGGLVKHPGR